MRKTIAKISGTVALFTVGGALIIGGIYIAYKMFRKKKEHK